MSMRAKLWSMSALAVELAKDRRTVAKALKGVAPDGQHDGHPAWFMATAVRALFEQPQPGELDPAQERARKDRALAEKTEMENDVTRGSVVLVDDVQTIVAEQLGRLRNRLLGIPARVSPRAAAMRDPNQVHELVMGEVVMALGELSSGAAIARAAGKVDAD